MNALLYKLADEIDNKKDDEPKGDKPAVEEKAHEGNEDEKSKQKPDGEEQPAQSAQPSADLIKQLFDFFHKNPSPGTQKVQEFAQSIGMTPESLELAMHSLCSMMVTFLRSGKSAGVDPNAIDQEQLKIGVEFEKEHCDIPMICKKIASDHLVENPAYYQYLKTMEEQMGKDAGAATQEKVAALLNGLKKRA